MAGGVTADLWSEWGAFCAPSSVDGRHRRAYPEVPATDRLSPGSALRSRVEEVILEGAPFMFISIFCIGLLALVLLIAMRQDLSRLRQEVERLNGRLNRLESTDRDGRDNEGRWLPGGTCLFTVSAPRWRAEAKGVLLR